MPRIDPIQLLNCLSVLLSPNGGIKSMDEVQRLANLMTKFSKKLVSKCIYIQILKCTETELLGLFMGSGGWRLVHTWLTESIVTKNWPLVQELLELLLLCPVDIERLKTNNCPKLVKELSKDENHIAIAAFASKLVEQWLKTVKGEHVTPVSVTDIPQLISNAQTESKIDIAIKNEVKDEVLSEDEDKDKNHLESESKNDVKVTSDAENIPNDIKSESNIKTENVLDKEPETLPVLKITLKNGKQTISQIDEEPDESKLDKDQRNKSKDKDKSSDKSSSSSRSSSSSKHTSKSHSSSDRHKSSQKSSSSKHNSSSSSKENKERSKDKEKRSSHSSSSKSSSSKESSRKSGSSSGSKSKEDRSSKSISEKEKDKSKEKDKVKDEKIKDNSQKIAGEKSDDKLQSPSIHKLGKIPKLSDVKKEKPSISIEVRKPDEPKPKTVKTFHSKFRKHGLEEEIKPPPSRASLLNKKPVPVIPPTVPIPKRLSPIHNESPPEKKQKTIEIEKPGAIKLIPPKPKPMLLQESDMFMDALNASATNKKEPKKRKRRTSGSKDGSAPNDGSPPHTPTTVSSPSSESKSVPPRFYQDTLDTEDNKEKPADKAAEDSENTDTVEEKTEAKQDTTEAPTITVNGLKGVLCYHKKKGPKKSIKWKPDSELEEIQYFELDETERVNVTKTFTDMKYLERIHEREAFQKARNLSNDDIMEERTIWRALIPVDVDGQIHVEYGKNSKEKDIQAIRQKGTLQPLYFHKSMIPDSPFEPDIETHTYSEPTIIPLDDVTGNQDNISDFRNMPWPEPKGNAPPTTTTNINVAPMFPTNIAQFPNNFPPAQFPGVPGFQGPPMAPGDWQNGIPPHMMPNGMPGPIPPAGLPPGAIPPPGMMVTPETMMMGPDMFGAPSPMFPVPPEGFNMPQNMFPMDFNMPGPQGLVNGPEAFTGPLGNFRGAMRGRGSNGHWRGKGSGNWEGPPRGRGAGHSRGGRKAVCRYFQNKGSCRQGDNCTYLHPGANYPY